MNIKIWADFTCPFCYIGMTNLFKALENFQGQVEIEYKSYMIMAEIEYEEGKLYMDQLAQDHGFDEETKLRSQKNVEKLGQEAGITFDFENMKLGNSLDCHRLLQYTKTIGKSRQLFKEIFKAVFENGRLVSDQETIMEMCKNIDLDLGQVEEILKNKELYISEVLIDIRQALNIGVKGVPFFLINDKYALVGAQPVEGFEEVLNKRK